MKKIVKWTIENEGTQEVNNAWEAVRQVEERMMDEKFINELLEFIDDYDFEKIMSPLRGV
tara:strand:+ start:2119 stop:2298 length:180 start_codon:yes stop_codon:yes gene_type:complete